MQCFYVAQTKRSACDRLKDHLRDIKKFIAFIMFTSEVGMIIIKKHELDKSLSIETDIETY
jgi:hypothetical protein